MRQLPLPPPLPLLALPDGTFFSLPYSKTFRFPGRSRAGYKTAACRRWLVFPRDEGCFLCDPFARATMTLPALSRVQLWPPNAVARYIHHGVHNVGYAEPCTWMHLKEIKVATTISKLIMCSPNLVAAFVSDNRHSQILVCQPGASSWSVRANDEVKMFQDMHGILPGKALRPC